MMETWNWWASVDYSGRPFFDDVVVMRRSSSTVFSMQHLPALDITGLKGRVLDIDGDRKMEIVLSQALTPYVTGALPGVKWTAIYAWDASLYEDRSTSFAA